MNKNKECIFLADDAEKYGVEKAHILWVLRFFGGFGGGATVKQMLPVFSYMNRDKMARLLRGLEAEKAIVSGEVSDNRSDRTRVYKVAEG